MHTLTFEERRGLLGTGARAWVGVSSVRSDAAAGRGASDSRAATRQPRHGNAGGHAARKRTHAIPQAVAELLLEQGLTAVSMDAVAARAGVSKAHGSRELVYLQEVDLGERPAILRRYLECASGARSRIPVDRRLSVKEFEDIADQYPVFHVMPEQATRGSMPRSGLLVMAGRGVRL